MNTLSVPALPTPARSQPRALRPTLLPRTDWQWAAPSWASRLPHPASVSRVSRAQKAVIVPSQELCVPSSVPERQCEVRKALQALWPASGEGPVTSGP